MMTFEVLKQYLVNDDAMFVAPEGHFLTLNGEKVLHITPDVDDENFVSVEFVNNDNVEIPAFVEQNFNLFRIIQVF